MAKTKPESSTKAAAKTLKLAEACQASLPKENPSFVKEMLPSHISGGFWLGLSSDFCNAHILIPSSDKLDMKLIENESRSQSISKLLSRNNAQKHGLSGGWKGFAQKHKLKEGDVLVFELRNSDTFEVYIFRGPEKIVMPDVAANIENPAEKIEEKNQDLVAVMENAVDAYHGDPILPNPVKTPRTKKTGHVRVIEKPVDAYHGDPVLPNPVKTPRTKKTGHVRVIEKPVDAYYDGEILTVAEYAVQCENCFRWRLIEALEQLEEIRSDMIKNPFVCNMKPNVSCDDPCDRELDASRTWVIDTPGLPITPNGFTRNVEVRGDFSRCDIVYEHPNGKKIRSFSELKKFLEDHPEYNKYSLLDFTFTAPMIMDTVPVYVRVNKKKWKSR